jgi:hypothetical protein
MTGPARVHDIAVLRDVKAALQAFAQEAQLAVASVNADVERVGQWIASDRPAHWKHEVRRNEEKVEAAKAEIRRKEFAAYPNPADTSHERKLLRQAQQRLERAAEKRETVRKWSVMWERESAVFKSGCGPLNEILHREVPQAIARLERMMESLDEYMKLAAPRSQDAAGASRGPSTGDDAGDGASMRRDGDAKVDPLDAAARYARLREFHPSDADRAAANAPAESGGPDAATSLPRIDWRAGVPNESDALELQRLARSGESPAPDARLMFARRAVQDTGVYLLRLAPLDERDSGWYLGPLENPASTGGLRACSTDQFRRAVPALDACLDLDVGTLIVLERGAIKAVLDGRDRDTWSRAE